MNEVVKEDFSVEALKARDRAEFARLVEEYSGQIYRLGLKMLHTPQDAEDVLQETFIKAFRHIEGFDGRSRVSTWLYRIAANEALMILRRRQPDFVSIHDTVEGDDGDYEPVQIVDWCCLPESELLSSEGRHMLDQAVDGLPANLRVVSCSGISRAFPRRKQQTYLT
jgi:RNA polymerase sigma-70 factor, ECF subfamily